MRHLNIQSEKYITELECMYNCRHDSLNNYFEFEYDMHYTKITIVNKLKFKMLIEIMKFLIHFFTSKLSTKNIDILYT